MFGSHTPFNMHPHFIAGQDRVIMIHASHCNVLYAPIYCFTHRGVHYVE